MAAGLASCSSGQEDASTNADRNLTAGDTQAQDPGTTVGADDEHSHEPGAPSSADHHDGESDITYDHLPPGTKAEVDQVIAEWAQRYPTAGDAAAAGWIKGTPNLYGIGAHYFHDLMGFSVAKPFDMLQPNILLYDGEGPDARFAGVSYVVAGDVEGFTGEYDFWHAHSTVCMKDGKISLTEENSERWYSDSECTAAGGRVMPLASDRMIHLWIGPGYTDAPIFAHDNPELFDGYYPKSEGET